MASGQGTQAVTLIGKRGLRDSVYAHQDPPQKKQPKCFGTCRAYQCDKFHCFWRKNCQLKVSPWYF